LFMILIFLSIFLAACSKEVTEEDLIGGTWEATAGFEDGEEKGEPYCNPLEEGLEFKDEDTVYVNDLGQDFDYWIKEEEGKDVIKFYHSKRYLRYYIFKISDDEMGITRKGTFQEDASCFLERK